MNRNRTLEIFVMIVSLAAGLYSQTYQGTISGTVIDKSGAVVVGASVVVTNAEKNTNLTLKTNGAGQYTAPNLEPGTYTLTVEAAGFQKSIKNDVILDVGRTRREDFTLLPGAISQTIAVTEQAPTVDTTNAVLQSTFDNQEITNLPLQGRDFQNVIILTPGIERTPGGGFLTVTSNGNRYEDNNYIVDGIDDNDAYYGETVLNSEGVQGTPATHLPIDAIQEFSIQTSPEAEYGWKPGAVVNLGIKSGTDQVHGSAYYFNRNNAYDARNFFNPVGQPESALNLHQYGASLGGPIIKNKLFYFVNYEGVTDKVGNPLFLNTPVTVPYGDPSVSIPDALSYCADPANGCPLSSVGVKIASYFPTNPGTFNATDPTLVPFDFNNLNSENNGIAKVDYQFSDHHQFSARYFYGASLQTEEDFNVLNPAWLSQANTTAQVFGVSWTWVPSPNVTNQLRFGYNNFWQQIYTADHNKSAESYGIDTGITDPVNYGFPQIRVSGFERLGGNGSWPLYTTPNKTYQITDNVSWSLGRHSLKFGGVFLTGSTNNIRNTYGKGRVNFSAADPCDDAGTGSCPITSLEALLSGYYQYGEVFEGNSHRQVSQKSFGLYVQDNWRMTSRLTITAGLRYDASLPITEAHDLLGNFNPAVGLVQVGRQISKPYNTDWNNFAPRLGFAWDIFGNGSTVLRAGGGIIYEIPHISLYIGQNGADATGLGTVPTGAIGDNGQTLTPGGTIAGSTLFLNSLDFSGNGPIFGNISPTMVNCTSDAPCAILGVDPNIRSPYVANWNVNIQHAFTNTLTLQMAYVGNRGIKLYSLRDINQNDYALDVNGDGQSGRPFTNTTICGNTCYPYLSFIDMLQNKDNSIYNGLQISLIQRSFKGLDFIAGYTWSHAIDMATGNRGATWEDAYNGFLERGNADSDIRNRFTLAMTYTMPQVHKWNALLGGWQLNNIVTLETPRPIDFYDSSDDFSGTDSGNDRWNIYGSPSNIKVGLGGIPFIAAGIDDNGNQYGDPQCLAIATAQGSIDTLNYAGGCFKQNGTIIIPPAYGQFGNMRRNQIQGFPFYNWDVGVGKVFKLTERFSLQFRAEIFNILNHPNFAGADNDLSDGYLGTVGIPEYTPDVAASNPVVGSGGSRHFQFGLKLLW